MSATLTVTVVGCSGSFPGPHGPASCYLIESTVDGVTSRAVLDLGNGSLGRLQAYTSPTDIDALLVTHLHADHFMDLCGLYVMRKYDPRQAPEHPQVVYGPRDLAWRLQLAYSGCEEPEMALQLDHRVVTDGEPIEVGSLRVLPVRVNHPIEAYGYRFESPAGTVAFTGDTDTCPALGPLLTGADLVLADAAFLEDRDTIRGIHLTARRAAQAALDAGGIGRLVLTHIPPWNDPEDCRAEAAELWPDVEVASPGARYVLSS
ncbi:MAG: MBL fold metallo-hydrolase [Dermatophilaceae bacterium]|nr:MBL fold metallo-hydrolase [Intrasporangiaceae bacterium]